MVADDLFRLAVKATTMIASFSKYSGRGTRTVKHVMIDTFVRMAMSNLNIKCQYQSKFPTISRMYMQMNIFFIARGQDQRCQFVLLLSAPNVRNSFRNDMTSGTCIGSSNSAYDSISISDQMYTGKILHRLKIVWMGVKMVLSRPGSSVEPPDIFPSKWKI